MAKSSGNYARACRFTVIVYAYVAAVAVTARVVPLHPYYDGQQNSAKIFDTSKYGILQLGNGLAQTPQMG